MEIKERLDRLEREIEEIRKALIRQRRRRIPGRETEEAWRTLVSLSEEISKRWKGASAVEEIRCQRRKRGF